MTDSKHVYLPQTGGAAQEPAAPAAADAPCPCCGCITVPNGGDALAFICPVCCWEIDLFLHDADEPSDQNHGLTLRQARQNYTVHGAVLPRLKPHCRPPRPEELPPQ